jgi:hypothetical protein
MPKKKKAPLPLTPELVHALMQTHREEILTQLGEWWNMEVSFPLDDPQPRIRVRIRPGQSVPTSVHVETEAGSATIPLEISEDYTPYKLLA